MFTFVAGTRNRILDVLGGHEKIYNGTLKVIETTVTAEIEDIDKTNGKVTLKFPNGKTQVVKVKDPSNLEKVDVGDTIVITIIKEIAISVQKIKQ